MDEYLPETHNEPEDPTAALAIQAETLADYLYTRTSLSKVTPKKSLMLSPPGGIPAEAMQALVPALGTESAHPLLLDVCKIQGKKDAYFYDKSVMTRQYAELDALLEDKDILNTIATVTRNDCRLYPRPLPYSKLRNPPFRFSMDEILGAVARMKDDPRYADIGVVTASNGQSGLYSSAHLSKGYAQSLLEWLEVGDKENP